MNLFSTTATAFSYTLAPATPKLILAQNVGRTMLLLQNTGGSNPATFKFQTAPASATDGFTLDPASTSGGQGGSLLLGVETDTIDWNCPIDAIWAYSQLGTNVTVIEGVVYEFL